MDRYYFIVEQESVGQQLLHWRLLRTAWVGRNERQACEWLRRIVPNAQPNMLVIFHADYLLGLEKLCTGQSQIPLELNAKRIAA